MPSDLSLIQALSHPLRIEILSSLEEQGATLSKLASSLQEDRSRLDYHVKILCDLALIRPTEGALNPDRPERTYEIAPPAFTQLLPGARLDAGAGSRLSHISGAFDSKGWREVRDAFAEFERRISDAKANAAKRLADAGSGGTEMTIALAGFESSAAPIDPPLITE